MLAAGKEHTKWSTARAAIKSAIVNDHLSLLRTVAGVASAEGLSSDEISSKILELLDMNDDYDVQDEGANGEEATYARTLSQNLVMNALQWLDQNNLTLPCDVCSAFQDASKEVMLLVAGISGMHGEGDMSLTCVGSLAANVLFSAVPTDLLQATTTMLKKLMQNSTLNIEELSAGIYNNSQQMERTSGLFLMNG